MSEPAAELTPLQAQELMSQLLDGELSPTEASRLYGYLDAHPEAMEWMESVDAIRSASEDATPFIDNYSVAQQVLTRIEAQPSQNVPKGAAAKKLIHFPKRLVPLAAAAAIALAGVFTWNNLSTTTDAESEFLVMQGSEVEFVSTDIPDASPVVYTNDETGWTVVWVQQMEPIPEEV